MEQAVLPALRHRIILNFEGEAEGIQSDKLLKDLIDQVDREAPTAAAV